MAVSTRALGAALIGAAIVLFLVLMNMDHNEKLRKLTTLMQAAVVGKGGTGHNRVIDGHTDSRGTGHNHVIDGHTDSRGAVRSQAEEEPNFPDDDPSMVYLRKYGRVKNLPTDAEMAAMSEKELSYMYHSYLSNTDYQCQRMIRLGSAGDGGYETCDDYQYRPLRPCLVYSFGIRNDFSFDDDAALLYGCNVSSFDPSMKAKTHRRSDKVSFYKLGIGGNAHAISNYMHKHRNWPIKTLSEIKAILHHENKTLDLLKMDIEASEWAALENAIATGELSKARQLLIEFHPDPTVGLRREISILRNIEALGFRRFRTHLYPGKRKQVHDPAVFPVGRIPCCYELGFVNERLAIDFSVGKK